jgi:hypothetical protein
MRLRRHHKSLNFIYTILDMATKPKVNQVSSNWNEDLGTPTYTLVPCWMPKPLPPKNQCTGWFATTLK